MHYSKTFSELLQSLPPELRENAIQYRQLKKLINQVVHELSALGLNPAILHDLFESNSGTLSQEFIEDIELKNNPEISMGDVQEEGVSKSLRLPRVSYEFNSDTGRITPRLRVSLNIPNSALPRLNGIDSVLSNKFSIATSELPDALDPNSTSEPILEKQLLRLLQKSHNGYTMAGSTLMNDGLSGHIGKTETNLQAEHYDVLIPLVSDTQFFQMLSTALQSVSAHLSTIHTGMMKALDELARNISDSARPSSVTSSFQPQSSLTSHAGLARVSNSRILKSDLYTWREIFQLYVEAEIFESISESNRGERSLEESEERLKLFVDRVIQRGLRGGGKMKLKTSRASLEAFFELNIFILNIRKFSRANAEATRKILKKHTKRTALPLPGSSSTIVSDNALSLSQLNIYPPDNVVSLPKLLVQAIGEILLPIIPHVDDYACIICTSLAFKPIRLSCGHLFCVRCLVKMQKRGNGNCPVCRAPSVLTANKSNVDWALFNFMQDWFPREAKMKLKLNEREAAEEELRELGLDPNQTCTIA